MKALVTRDTFIRGNPIKGGLHDLEPQQFQELQGAGVAVEYDPKSDKHKKQLEEIEERTRGNAARKTEGRERLRQQAGGAPTGLSTSNAAPLVPGAPNDETKGKK